MTNMTNLRLLKDGNRLIIVIDNADIGMEQLLKNMISGALQTEQVEGLIPAPVKEQDQSVDLSVAKDITPHTTTVPFITDQNDQYYGVTPAQALQKDGDKAFVYFWNQCKKRAYAGNIAKEVSQACRSYMASFQMRADSAESLSEEAISEFFDLFSDILSVEIKSMLQEAGYSTMDNFMNMEPLDIKRAGYRDVINAFLKRI